MKCGDNDSLLYLSRDARITAMALTVYERVKRWRQKNKKNADYKNLHRRKKRRLFRKLLREGKIRHKDIPKSYNITKLKSPAK